MTLHAVPDTAGNPLTVTLPDAVISHPVRVPDGYEVPPPSRCPTCRESIDPGSRIRKVHSVWMHSECARQTIAAMGPSQTWLMLAENVAATPSKFKASEIRAIVRAVIDIAADVPASPLPGGEEK